MRVIMEIKTTLAAQSEMSHKLLVISQNYFLMFM